MNIDLALNLTFIAHEREESPPKEEDKQKRQQIIANLCRQYLGQIASFDEKRDYTLRQFLEEQITVLLPKVEDKQYHTLLSLLQKLHQNEMPEITYSQLESVENGNILHILLKEKAFYPDTLSDCTPSPERNFEIANQQVKQLYEVFKRYVSMAYESSSHHLNQMDVEFSFFVGSLFNGQFGRMKEFDKLISSLSGCTKGISRQVSLYTREHYKRQGLIDQFLTQKPISGAEYRYYLMHLFVSYCSNLKKHFRNLKGNCLFMKEKATPLDSLISTKMDGKIGKQVKVVLKELEKPNLNLDAFKDIKKQTTDVLGQSSSNSKMNIFNRFANSLDNICFDWYEDASEHNSVMVILSNLILDKIEALPVVERREDHDLWLSLIDTYEETVPVIKKGDIKQPAGQQTVPAVDDPEEIKVEEIPKTLSDLKIESLAAAINRSPEQFGLLMIRFSLLIEERAAFSRDSLDHLYLASCGLHKMLTAFEKGEYAQLGVIVPMLIRDWHTAIEQAVATGEKTTHHLKAFNIEDKFKGLAALLDHALIWSRYPYSSAAHYRERNRPLPELLETILFCVDLAKGKIASEKQLKELFDQMIELHLTTLGMFTFSKELYDQLLKRERPEFKFSIQKQKGVQQLSEIEREIEKMKVYESASTNFLLEAEGHLNRFYQGVRLFLRERERMDSFIPLYFHYVLDLQWLFESLYHHQLETRGLGRIQTHNLSLLHETIAIEEQMLDDLIRRDPNITLPKALESFNIGIGGHYSRRIHAITRHPTLKQYISALNYGKKFADCESGFLPAGVEKKEGESIVSGVNALIKAGVDQLKQMLK